METLSFLETVLARGGQYCAFAAKPDGPKKQKFYPTIDRMLHAALELDYSGHDAYFGLAAFGDTGKREAANALYMRSLFIDLDCGPTKDYPDASTALVALRKFCTDTHMPRPIMVSSGYGVHVYWPFDADEAVSDWKPVALALKRTCAAHGLYIDTNVTADAARILRVPGTQNRKRGTTARVVIQTHPAEDGRGDGLRADRACGQRAGRYRGAALAGGAVDHEVLCRWGQGRPFCVAGSPRV